MKINTTVELTQEDLLQAITDYAKSEYRWSNDTIAGGEALSVSNHPNGTVLVMWGKREEPKPEPMETTVGTPNELREPNTAEEFAAQIILGSMTSKPA